MKINLYSFFHLNLAYSAIELDDRKIVIQKCYWPLLKLIRKYSLPFSIELSGYTLEQIYKIDPDWVNEFKSLFEANICELIGCGYCQIIAPLVPAYITSSNLKLGNDVYMKYLERKPDIALLNEQAFSKGIVPLYLNENYKSIIMEWNNPANLNPHWDQECKYYSQLAKGSNNTKINLIWNHSINFQKFQRYVHGEIDIKEFLSFIDKNISPEERSLTIYGNDVEVFDFRPGRYMTEEKINEDGEWLRIEKLYRSIININKYRLIKTSEVLNFGKINKSNKLLNLSTPKEPIPVKKQDKYNVLRWAVTGRNDIKINSDCYKLYEIFKSSQNVENDDLRKLCYFWSSDFRTHITEKRWLQYKFDFESFKNRILKNHANKLLIHENNNFSKSFIKKENFAVINQQGKIAFKGDRLNLIFNKNRGLALDSFIDKNYFDNSLFGTLSHGYYNNISYSADFYSGNLIFDIPGKHKLTDLNKIKPIIENEESKVIIKSCQTLSKIDIRKIWTIDDNNGVVNLNLQLHFKKQFSSTIRINAITLNPESFNIKNLFFAVKNGGNDYERFFLKEFKNIDYSDPLSLLISARTAIGITDGNLFIGDNSNTLKINIDKTKSALVGLIKHEKLLGSYFTRAILTAREIDDTSKTENLENLEFDISFSVCKTDTIF